jgi:hypothetical protein
MSDRLQLDLLGAAPELGTLRLLDHAIQTTLDLLAALHPKPELVPPAVDDLVVALLDAKDLADAYATGVCRGLMRTEPVAYVEDDIF